LSHWAVASRSAAKATAVKSTSPSSPAIVNRSRLMVRLQRSDTKHAHHRNRSRHRLLPEELPEDLVGARGDCRLAQDRAGGPLPGPGVAAPFDHVEHRLGARPAGPVRSALDDQSVVALVRYVDGDGDIWATVQFGPQADCFLHPLETRGVRLPPDAA